MRARTTVVSVASAVLVGALWPALALARAVVRFVHAVPGAGQAELQISGPKGGGTSVGRAAFGDATPYRGVESGPIAWRLVGAGTGKVLATGRAMLRDGSYTVVALAQSSGAALAFLHDHAGVPGRARLRLVHGAPELGAPDLRLDGRIVARGVRFSQATPYLLVRPGIHSVAVTPPGHASPVVRRDGIRLLAGEAATGLVLGTKGQPTRIVALQDGGSRASSHRPSSRRAAPRASTPARRGAGGGAGARMVTVRRGDSLWSIAQRRLGGSASGARVQREVRRLWSANSRRIGTGDPNLLFPGQRLRVG